MQRNDKIIAQNTKFYKLLVSKMPKKIQILFWKELKSLQFINTGFQMKGIWHDLSKKSYDRGGFQ